MLERIPLHTLRTFVIAAHREKFRATAIEVNLTHGAVSQQIQQLEQAVGCALFDRQGRGITLNAAGKKLLAAVEPALAQLERGIRDVQQLATRKPLRISVPPSFAQHWLLPRLADFHQHYAHLALEIDASLTVEDLSRGKYDAAIRIGDGVWSSLAIHHLAEGYVIPVCAPEHYLEWKKAFNDRGNVPLMEHNVTPWQQWFSAPVETVATFNDAGLLINAAQQGLGIALVKHLLVKDALSAGRLMALAEPQKLDNSAFYMVCMPTAEKSEPVHCLLAWLKQQLHHQTP